MAVGTTVGFLGNAAPLRGEMEFVQITVATDFITLTGGASMTGDFLVLRDSAEAELVYVSKDGHVTLNDSVQLRFGTGLDVLVKWDGTNLIIDAAADDSLIEIGDSAATQKSFDLKWYANEASGASYLYFDASANLVYTTGVDIQFKDNDILVLGTGAGASGDVQIRWDGTDLDILATADDSVIKIGNGTESFDLWIYGNVAGDYILWDASASTLTLKGDAKMTYENEIVHASAKTQTKSGAYTMTAADSGYITYVDTTAVITLPATVVGYSYTFVNAGADGAVQISIDPAAADQIQGVGLTAADNKDLINTLATAKKGDKVQIVGDGVNGWFVVAMSGTWARE